MSRGADLDHPDDIKVAVRWAKEALSAMTKDIPSLHSELYRVLEAARNPTLKRAINKMIGEVTEFSSFVNAELFEKFLGLLKKARESRKPANKSTIPQRSQHLLSGAADGTESYKSTLS